MLPKDTPNFYPVVVNQVHERLLVLICNFELIDSVDDDQIFKSIYNHLKAWCPVLEIMKNLKGYQLGLKCNFELINIVEVLQLHM